MSPLQLTLMTTKFNLNSRRIVQILFALQFEPQIALFEIPNTRKAPLAYQNHQQFTELSHFNLSITNKPQIFFLISTQNHIP